MTDSAAFNERYLALRSLLSRKALSEVVDRNDGLNRIDGEMAHEFAGRVIATYLAAINDDDPAQGWKLVPLEPTEAMLEAAVIGSKADVSYADVDALWPAMLDAAPLAEGRPASNDLREAVENLFAGGFIEAGTRANDQWSCELAARVERLRNALATCRSPAEKVVPDASRTIAGVSQRFDPLPSQPATSPTIDNVPSCGQENDYRRARPSQPETEPQLPAAVKLLSRAFGASCLPAALRADVAAFLRAFTSTNSPTTVEPVTNPLPIGKKYIAWVEPSVDIQSTELPEGFIPPAACEHPNSCHRHGQCMYVGCPAHTPHDGRLGGDQ